MKYGSLFALMEAFPNEESCVRHLEMLRWPKGIVCPCCGSTRKVYRLGRGSTYKCADCQNQFSVRKGTIFEESRLPLRKWFAASWLVTSNRAEFEVRWAMNDMPEAARVDAVLESSSGLRLTYRRLVA